MIHEFRRASGQGAGEHPGHRHHDRARGRIGNLSQTDPLLIASEPLVDDALYRFGFVLPGEGDGIAVDVGAHLLWLDSASAPGQAWAGFRFIAVPEAHARRMQAWIEAPGSHYE